MYAGFVIFVLPSLALAAVIVNLPVNTCSNLTTEHDITIALGCLRRSTTRVVQKPSNCDDVHVCCYDDPSMGPAIKFLLHQKDHDRETNNPARQRLEMYLHSCGKEAAKAQLGNTFKYIWWFKLEGVEVSDKFYHIFQLKPQDPYPAMTLTLTTEHDFHARFRVGNESSGKLVHLASLDQVFEQWVFMSVMAVFQSESSGGRVTINMSTESGYSKTITENNTMFNPAWGTHVASKWGLYRDKTGTPAATRTHVQLFKSIQIVDVNPVSSRREPTSVL